MLMVLFDFSFGDKITSGFTQWHQELKKIKPLETNHTKTKSMPMA